MPRVYQSFRFEKILTQLASIGCCIALYFIFDKVYPDIVEVFRQTAAFIIVYIIIFFIISLCVKKTRTIGSLLNVNENGLIVDEKIIIAQLNEIDSITLATQSGMIKGSVFYSFTIVTTNQLRYVYEDRDLESATRLYESLLSNHYPVKSELSLEELKKSLHSKKLFYSIKLPKKFYIKTIFYCLLVSLIAVVVSVYIAIKICSPDTTGYC